MPEESSSSTIESPSLDIPVRIELGPEGEPPGSGVAASDGLASPLPAPERVRPTLRAAGRYAIQSEIGRGGMATVYRAFDRDLRRHVAMKVARTPLRARNALGARFVEEAQATAQLQHPAIVPVYEMGIVEPPGEGPGDAAPRLFFTMKLIRGRTLARLVRDVRAGGTDAREYTRFRLVQVVLEVARAVAYAHDRGLVHRDLKPANIMIGDHGEVHVMDWGLAKVLARSGEADGAPSEGEAPVDAGRRGETGAGRAMGTPGYMPPEQARGDAARIGPASDVYALGATLFFVLTGRAPFTGGSTPELIARTIDEDAPAPRDVEATVPPELDAIARRALARDAGDRYPSALELAEDLQAFLELRPIRAYPEGAGRRALKFARRHALPVVAAAALGVVASLGLAASLWQRAAASREAREAAVDGARTVAGRTADVFRAARAEVGARAEARDRLLGLGLDALQAAERLATLSGDADARRAASEAAIGLGDIAREAEQWLLAESAYGRAGALGLEPERMRATLDRLDRERNRTTEERRRAVEAILAEVRSGVAGTRPQGALRAVVALAGHRHADTAARLARELDAVAATLTAAVRETVLEAATPTAAEATAGAGPISGLEGAIEALLAAPDSAALPTASAAILEAAGRRLERRAALRVDAGTRIKGPDLRRILADAQRARLGPGGAMLAQVACDGLGVMGRDAGLSAAPALTQYLAVERDDARAAGAAKALLKINPRAAGRLVFQVRSRFGPSFWVSVAPEVAAAGIEPPLATESAPAYVERAALRTTLADRAGARADYSRALELESRSLDAWIGRAGVAAGLGDLDSALADAERAVELDPTSARAYACRGQVHLERRNDPSALADASRAIELAPGEAAGHKLRADTLRNSGAAADAVASYTKALALTGSAEAAAAIQEDLAGARFLLGDYRAAAVAAARAIEVLPGSAFAWLQRGRARVFMGEVAEGLADLERAIAIAPGFGLAYFERGRAREEGGDLAGAEVDYSRAIELAPRLADAWNNRAINRFTRGDVEAAVADAKRATEIEPTHSKYRTTLGMARDCAGDTDGAIADYGRALQLDPRDSFAWINRAVCREAKGDLDGAIADSTEGIRLAPTDVAAWINRASARIKKREHAGALADLNRADELSPGDRLVLVNRAAVREGLGDVAGARADLDRAIELSPDYALAWLKRGELRDRMGDAAGALADLTAAIERDPGLVEAREARAKVRERLRDAAGAAADREAAARLVTPKAP